MGKSYLFGVLFRNVTLVVLKSKSKNVKEHELKLSTRVQCALDGRIHFLVATLMIATPFAATFLEIQRRFTTMCTQ